MAAEGDRRARVEAEHALDPFRNDLWITRRLELDEVIEKLHQGSSVIGHEKSRRPDDSSRQEVIREYIKFVEFLRDQCSGQQFTSDRQWGRLLNLMGVSRLVNHRSAKFRDILANKQNIEANAQDIQNFNNSVKLSLAISKAIQDLGTNLDSCKMTIGSIGAKTTRQSMIVEICKAERYLDNMCGPLVYNLGMQLHGQPVDANFNQERDVWLDKHKNLERKYESIVRFLKHLHGLYADLVDIDPLMTSLDSTSDQRKREKPPLAIKTKSLQSSLETCKKDFAKIIILEGKIVETLRSHMKQAAASMSNAIHAKKQQVNSLHLIRLLDSQGNIKSDPLTTGLGQAIDLANACRNTLSDIKRNLRLEFGRFYFINDVELLTVIALDTRLVEQSSDPEHARLICKIFNNAVKGFIVKKGDKSTIGAQVVGVKNSIGEVISFDGIEPIALRKPVNIYSLEVVRILNEVLRKLQRSLRRSLQNSIESWLASDKFNLRSPADDIDWSLTVQLIDLAEHIKFTYRVENSLKPSTPELPGLKSLLDFYEARLAALKSMTSVVGGEQTSELTGLKISAAISITIHFLSLLITLQQASVESITDWTWRKTARFYTKKIVDAKQQEQWMLEIEIANARFPYRFDLLMIETTASTNQNAATSRRADVKRLISTETSDRCFLVASQAITKLRSGASPYGPAGSGKTETIKALGNLLGCQVIVHNCDETNDAEALERLIWGLAHTGLWGCFDEFNRLGSSTLSSVSAVLELVQANLRFGRATIELDDGQIKCIDPDSAFFVTLNPGDALKYRGRRRLPANLRAMFLPVAMYRVQIETIVRELLLVYGCNAAHLAPTTMVALKKLDTQLATELGLKLAKWIRASQEKFKTVNVIRCEFDLRLVLSILNRFFRTLTDDGVEQRETDLNSLLVESICSEVMPRLARDEVPLLNEGLTSVFQSKSITNQVDTGQQLKQQLEARPGVVLLGATGSGKSASWSSLLHELNRDKRQIAWFALNPKAYNKDHLFGHYELSTKRWIDGIFTKIVRDASAQLQNEADIRQAWIILDGPIDPDWIECLNSVLDDNQVLTLSSGERINFILSPRRCIKLIFETSSIDCASPATISRLGLVNHEPDSAPTVNGPIRGSERVQLYIIHGGDQRARLKRAQHISGSQSKTINYYCHRHLNSQLLVDLLQMSAGQEYAYIIQDIDIVQAEDRWATRTFIEMLRYVITYGHYHDQDMNQTELSAMIVITVASMDLISDLRLVSLAKTIEEVQSGDLCTPEVIALNSINKERLVQPSDSNIIVLESHNSVSLTRHISDTIESIDSVFGFNNSAAQAKSMEKLESFLRIRHQQEAAGKCCLFLINSLELSLMDLDMNRRWCHIINMLRIKNLMGHQIKLIICLDESAKLERSFWSSMGESFAVSQSSGSVGDELRRALTRQNADKFNHIDWLSDKVVNIAQEADCKMQNSFIEVLVGMILRLKESAKKQERTITIGLSKLSEFEVEIEQIKSSRRLENDTLQKKRAQIETLMSKINEELRQQENKKNEIEKLESELGRKSDELNRQSVKIQKELEQVLPLIESSKREVSRCLKPEALNEIKTLRAPPKTIKDILDVLFLFLNRNDNSWTSIKAYLTKSSLKDELTSYDFGNRLTETLLRKIEQEIGAKSVSFAPEQAKRASSAILPIVKWIEAAVQYGRVSVKVKPLQETKRQLEDEAKELTESMAKLQAERKLLDSKVVEDNQQLEVYQTSYNEAVAAGKRIESELVEAQSTIANSEHQIAQWKKRLGQFEQLSSDCKHLYRTCLVSTILALPSTNPGNMTDLMRLVVEVKLIPNDDHTTLLGVLVGDYVNTVLDCLEESCINMTTTGPDQLIDILHLIRLKLCLIFKHYPLIPHLSFKRSEPNDKLVSWLSSGNIICSPDEISLVRPSTSNCGNWRQAIDLAAQMNKFVSIELQQTTSLEVFDYVLSHHDTAKLILFSNDWHNLSPELSQILNTSHIDDATPQSMLQSGSIEIKIVNMLMQKCDPKSSELISKLESELRSKKREAKMLESSLMKHLIRSSDCGAGVGSSGALSVVSTRAGGLIRILAELHKTGDRLRCSIEEMSQKLHEHRKRLADLAPLANHLGALYGKFLLDLQNNDEFYCISIERLVAMISTAAKMDQYDTLRKLEFGINELALVLAQVMCSLRSGDRLKFEEKLLRELAGDKLGQVIEVKNNAISPAHCDLEALVENCSRQAANLDWSLTNLLSTKPSELAPRPLEFAILLHDEKQPSPQVILDELFRRWRQAAPTSFGPGLVEYHKVYATSKRQSGAAGENLPVDRLETQLQQIIMSSPPNASNHRVDDSSSSPTAFAKLPSSTSSSSGSQNQLMLIRCICVANAHLATTWFNTRFLELIKELRGRLIGQKRHLNERHLIILVGESSQDYELRKTTPTTTAETLVSEDVDRAESLQGDRLDAGLLEEAALKFWYDELALNARDRYNLYLQLLRDSRSQPESSGSGGGGRQVGGLAVVSRELSGQTNGSQTTVTSANDDGSTGNGIDERLVMFHVVCQELVRLRRNQMLCDSVESGPNDGCSKLLWQRPYYNFDYEQLSLATKIWHQMEPDDSGSGASNADQTPRRDLFVHLLESIVYGSRLETLEDEQLLAKLLWRFIARSPKDRNGGGGRDFHEPSWQALERLISIETAPLSAAEKVIECTRELARLIGIPSID